MLQKMTHLQIIYLLNIVIFNSYVKLPEGILFHNSQTVGFNAEPKHRYVSELGIPILTLWWFNIPMENHLKITTLLIGKSTINGHFPQLPSGKQTQLLNMAIEIVSFPMKNGDFSQLCKRLPEAMLEYQRVDINYYLL